VTGEEAWEAGKDSLANLIGLEAGVAVGGACEASTAIETIGMSTPLCIAAGVGSGIAATEAAGTVLDHIPYPFANSGQAATANAPSI